MKRPASDLERSTTPIGQLEKKIMDIAFLTDRYPIRRMRAIMALGMPTVSEEPGKLTFLNQPELWEVLKKDESFWTGVLEAMRLPTFQALDEDENALFGIDEVTDTLSETWYEEANTLLQLTKLDPRTKKRLVRDAFLKYMHWYDKTATPNFLIVYAQTIKDKLVSIATTLTHPVAKPVTVPIPISSALELVSLKSVYIISTLDYHSNTNHFKYLFYMKKPTEENKVLQFTVQLGDQQRHVATDGIITRILKFFYKDMVMLVISGTKDDMLIRFTYNPLPERLIVVKQFILRPHLEWDDLVYVDESQPTRFATNVKSVTNPKDFFVVDLALLSVMRSIGSLFPEERKKYVELSLKRTSLSYGERLLENDEREMVIQNRRRKGNFFPLPLEVKLKDITPEDLAVVQKLEFDIPLYNTDNFDIVTYNISALPASPTFTFNKINHTKGEVESLGWKIIRVPEERREDRFHLAVLARKYLDNDGAFSVYIYLYGYTKNTKGVYVPESGKTKWIDLENVGAEKESDRNPLILERDTPETKYTVKEFNVIFHNNHCYVEIMQLAVPSNQIKMMSSVRFNFRPDYIKSMTPPPNFVVDSAFLELMTQEHHYKIYDYRHDVVPNRLFDCIFTKYYYATKQLRIIVYKSQENGNAPPSIADIRGTLDRPGIMLLSPMHKPNNLFSVVFESKPDRAFKVLLKADRHLVSLPENYNLSASLSGMAIEYTHCVFCGTSKARKDMKSGYFYCGKVCQYLFCKTRAM